MAIVSRFRVPVKNNSARSDRSRVTEVPFALDFPRLDVPRLDVVGLDVTRLVVVILAVFKFEVFDLEAACPRTSVFTLPSAKTRSTVLSSRRKNVAWSDHACSRSLVMRTVVRKTWCGCLVITPWFASRCTGCGRFIVNSTADSRFIVPVLATYCMPTAEPDACGV